jgi:hypothetical protein
MPRSSVARKAAPPSLELRRYQAPRPANDAHSPALPGNRNAPGTPPKSFGKRTRSPLDDARDEALRRGVHTAITLVTNAVVPRPLQQAIDGLDYIGSQLRVQNVTVANPGNGWILVGNCVGGTGNNWAYYSAQMNGNFARSCLGGQAGAVTSPEAAEAAGAEGLIWANWNAAVDRYQHIRNYSRIRPWSQTVSRTWITRHPSQQVVNPNVMRWVNPTPQPLGIPAPALAPAPAPHTIVEIVSTPRNRNGLRPRPRPQPRVARAARSSPPPANTKEIKGKLTKAVAEFVKYLDRLSEAAEVVTAIYDALPKDVRKRWDRDPATGKKRKFRDGDQMGQYGLDGADWKLQALAANWHKVDINEAVKNILANHLEDKLYGAAHKARSDLTYRGRKRPRKR